jgi:hypothetical protein
MSEHCFSFVISLLLLRDVLKALEHNRIALYCGRFAAILCPNPLRRMKMLSRQTRSCCMQFLYVSYFYPPLFLFPHSRLLVLSALSASTADIIRAIFTLPKRVLRSELLIRLDGC